MAAECEQMVRVSGEERKAIAPLRAAGHALTGIDGEDVQYHYRGLLIRRDVYGDDVWSVCAEADGEEYLDSINLQAVRTASELVDLLDTITEAHGHDRTTTDASASSEEVED